MGGQVNLVTGGSGFIGTFLCRRLMAEGEEVRILDVVPPPPDLQGTGITFVRADVRDAKKVLHACRDAKTVYHIVSLVPISKAGREFWNVNVRGSANVFEGALRHGVPKVVHMSSSAVYGVDRRNPLDESFSVAPLGVYGHSKWSGERVCQSYRDRGLDITIVRPRTVVGPERLGIYQILFDWVRRGKGIYIIGSGKNRIQFIHVEELAEALVAMGRLPGCELFNIGTDRFGTLRQDLQALINHAGTNSAVRPVPPWVAVPALKLLDRLNLSPLVDWHYLSYHKDFYFDVSKAKRLLGWQPKQSNVEMMCEAYDWYIAHRDKVDSSFGTTHKKSVKQRALAILRLLS